jgi:hypothetical protein
VGFPRLLPAVRGDGARTRSPPSCGARRATRSGRARSAARLPLDLSASGWVRAARTRTR